MERLSMIPEVASTEEETAPAVIAPMMSVFAPPVSLPEIRPQGIPSVISTFIVYYTKPPNGERP